MPTLQQILTDIDDRFPNTFTQDQKIRWLNIAQNEVFRELALNEILEFTTIKDQPVYDLYTLEGGRIEFELIKAVTIDGKKYEPKDLDDYATGYCYFKVLDDKIGFYPTPEKDDLVVHIFYEKRPKELSSSNLTATPDLREDYQEILKYGVFIIMAKTNNDVSLANNYTQDYNMLLRKIKQERFERMSKYPGTKDVMPRTRKISKTYFEVV